MKCLRTCFQTWDLLSDCKTNRIFERKNQNTTSTDKIEVNQSDDRSVQTSHNLKTSNK